MLATRKDLRFGCGWRGPRSSELLILFCILPLLILIVSCRSGQSTAQVVAALTSDRWTKELGTGMLRECYVYTFHTNGTYSACVFSDYGARPIRGTWRVTEQQGQAHLRLQNEEAYYFCLWRDSLIRFDKARDILILSGPHYTGEMHLQRAKGKPSEIGNRHRSPQTRATKAPPVCTPRCTF